MTLQIVLIENLRSRAVEISVGSTTRWLSRPGGEGGADSGGYAHR
jgi:hypothetical protein